MFGSDWEGVLFNKRSGNINIQNTFVGNIDHDQNLSGLIPRSIYELFKEVGQERNKSKEFAVYCSFLQVYNEKIFDLLTVIIVFLINVNFYRISLPQKHSTFVKIKWMACM